MIQVKSRDEAIEWRRADQARKRSHSRFGRLQEFWNFPPTFRKLRPVFERCSRGPVREPARKKARRKKLCGVSISRGPRSTLE